MHMYIFTTVYNMYNYSVLDKYLTMYTNNKTFAQMIEALNIDMINSEFIDVENKYEK